MIDASVSKDRICLFRPAEYALGPQGPFPDCRLNRVLERRWLHYALLSRDGDLGLVANVAWLGPPSENNSARPRMTSILLIHQRGSGWKSSQFNAETTVRSGPPFASRILLIQKVTTNSFDRGASRQSI